MVPVMEGVLQLIPAVAAFATGATAPRISDLSSSGELPPEAIFEKLDSYIEPQAPGPDLGQNDNIRAPMLFAAEGSSQSPAAGGGPSGLGSGNGGDDNVGGGCWAMRRLVGLKSGERMSAIRGMKNADELANTILLDLAGIPLDSDQLVYLSDIAKTMNEYVRAGKGIGWEGSISVLQMIARAVDGLTDYVKPNGVEEGPWIGGKPAIQLGKMLMRPILSATDYVERSLIASERLNRDLAYKLASIYQVAAMKGEIYEAEMERMDKGKSSLIYQAHVGSTILQLMNVRERFEGIDRTDIADGVQSALESFIAYHGVTQRNYEAMAIEAVVTFLNTNIDRIYLPVSVSDNIEGAERERLIDHYKDIRFSNFMTKVRYMIDGNRRFAIRIMFGCMKAFQGHDDSRQGEVFTELFKTEQVLTEKMMNAGFLKE